jgi:hypothetical protein
VSPEDAKANKGDLGNEIAFILVAPIQFEGWV